MSSLAMIEAIALTIMGAWLLVIGGGFFLRPHIDRASAFLLALAGGYAILWQEPTIVGVASDEFFHISLAQPVFLFFLSAAIFLWAYWLFQEHVEMLETTSEDLTEALTIEKTLLDILGHDLRNPLTVLQTRLSAISSGMSTYDAHADRIEESLLRAERIIDNSIIYSRLASRGRFDTEPVDLATVARETIQALETHADLKSIDIDLEAPESLEAEVTPLIRHAIENLLDNAIKYSPDGSTVRLDVTQAGETASISVLDQGPGMPEEAREELVQRFARGDPLATDGSGLGLAIVERLASLHDGTLDLEPGADGGTRITLTLPRSATDEDEEALDAPGVAKPASPAGGLA